MSRKAAHLILVDKHVGRQAGTDIVNRILEKTVIVQRENDRCRYGGVGMAEMAEVDLPEQVFAQRTGCLVGDLGFGEIAAVRLVLGPGFAAGLPGPPLQPAILVIRVIAGPGIGPFRSGLRLAGVGVTRSGAFGLELFQQGIGVYRLLYVVTQLQPVQLQQPDGLLQLRRQRQFLCEPDLKRLLNHR